MERKVIHIEETYDHIISELICINCKERFLDIRPLKIWLKDLECPKCHEIGYLIETGEVVSQGDYDRANKENPNLKIYRPFHQIIDE